MYCWMWRLVNTEKLKIIMLPHLYEDVVFYPESCLFLRNTMVIVFSRSSSQFQRSVKCVHPSFGYLKRVMSAKVSFISSFAIRCMILFDCLQRICEIQQLNNFFACSIQQLNLTTEEKFKILSEILRNYSVFNYFI